MLAKINEFLRKGLDFAFETTLSSKSFFNTIKRAKENGYEVTLLFFWLDSVELAIERVKTRVAVGGHDIPEKVIRRRYYSEIKNLFVLYMPVCDYWMITNNSTPNLELIAEGNYETINKIENNRIFELMKSLKNDNK